MPVELEIRDGEPWWLSPDVWTVPGSNPEGAPGQPVAGELCYLWARVRNNGTAGVQNATVRFYWADPSVGFDRSTANQIGTSFVSLDPAEDAEVLCLAPWVPTFVNGGHECILAEAFHNNDPLPATPAFNVPTDRHVAQRNLTVVNVGAMKAFSAFFTIVNTQRVDRAFELIVRQGRLEEIEPLSKTLGFKLPPKTREGKLTRAGFVDKLCVGEQDVSRATSERTELRLRRHGKAGRSLVGVVEGGAALLHVEQRLDGRSVGGLSVLVLGEAAGKESAT